MWPLAYRLRAGGFRVSQWSYSSFFAKIESHAERLCDYLLTRLSKEARVHLVAHSMVALSPAQRFVARVFRTSGE